MAHAPRPVKRGEVWVHAGFRTWGRGRRLRRRASSGWAVAGAARGGGGARRGLGRNGEGRIQGLVDEVLQVDGRTYSLSVGGRGWLEARLLIANKSLMVRCF